VHAMLIEEENGVWVYKVINAPGGNKTFYPEKNYFFPIPQSALNQNSLLTQNPGY
jgi:starch-binding outer membrane protein, SusD/RagB family